MNESMYFLFEPWGNFRQLRVVRFLGGFSLPFQAMSCGVARRRSTLELSGENSRKKGGNNKHGWGRKTTTFEAKWRFLQWFLSILPQSLTWNLEDSGWKMIWPLFRGHSVVFGGGFIVVLKGNIGNWKNVKTDGPPSAHWRYKQRSSPTDCWLDGDVGSDHSKWVISLPKVRFCASPNIRWTFQNILSHFSWKDLLPFSTKGLISFLHSDVCHLHFPGCSFFEMKMVCLPEGTNFQDLGSDGDIFKDSRLPAKGQLTITVFLNGQHMTSQELEGMVFSWVLKDINPVFNLEFRWLKYNLSSTSFEGVKHETFRALFSC